MTRFGGVLMSVMMPRELAKANGMSSRLGFTPAPLAIDTTMGSISATVPVLEMKAPVKPVTNITSINRRSSDSPASFIRRELTILASPV